MATTGSKLAVPHTVSGSAIVGQGNAPELWVLYSTDDAVATSLFWNDATAKVRSFTTSRGRESELAAVNAGTATIRLDNRTRAFDPVFNSLIRPMNRWWVKEQFTGETQDLFVGYADSYDQQWPSSVGDAEAIVSCTDEFKILALDRLPVTNPPRDTYSDVIAFDEPAGFWGFNDVDPGKTTLSNPKGGLVQGPTGIKFGGGGTLNIVTGAIIGSNKNFGINCTGAMNGGIPVSEGGDGDISGLTEMALEFWAKAIALPGADGTIIEMPLIGTGGAPHGSLIVEWRTTGQFRASAFDTSAKLASSSVVPLNAWRHYVVTVRSGTLYLYENGAESASEPAWTGPFDSVLDTDPTVDFCASAAADNVYLDEVAFYRHSLTAARIAAHYEAGALRGFVDGQLPGDRINAILSSAGSQALRSIQAGTRNVQGAFMHGQDPLGEIRQAVKAESVDALLFIAKDGTLTFLADGYRGSVPYSTVQCTFDDDGTDLPYADLDMDYSESFLANEWNVTRAGGLTQTASDTTSISRYYKRPQALTDLPVTTDGYASTIATAMLAKYKEPLTRITSLTLTTQVPDVAEAIFRRDIGDRIRVLRTPPGGGARIDQTLFIQKIEIGATNDGAPWQVRWGVSPV